MVQHPVIAFIDNTNLVRVTVTQERDKIKIDPDLFHIWDEDDYPLEIIDSQLVKCSLYLTGEFFDWKQNPKGKMIWDDNLHYYYCELPEKLVAAKAFKFIENSCIWYPKGENLFVHKRSSSYFQTGFSRKGNKVRFILKNNMFGFNSCELILRTRQQFSPERAYYLNYCCHHKIKLINRDIFNQPEFYYADNDLGCSWFPDHSVFKIWTPLADEMTLLIYKNPQQAEPHLSCPMNKIGKGVWAALLKGDWQNFYYKYQIKINGNTYQQIDPYSKALALNSTHSYIFDPRKTCPDGWDDHHLPLLKNPTDAVIYELHVRDFSVSPLWKGPPQHRGKYAGLLWSGELQINGRKINTGLAHLKELGVNVIQLLPVFDFNTVDETGQNAHKLRNWGYDPVAYNVPEGSYAVNGADHRRILEFKQMIMKLHEEGFKVVMDVVYNHTAHVGAPYSIFDTFMPEYFYRMDSAGHYTNGSGCGNEIASEKPMVRKYIIDSLIYWLTHYKIDGFRFDLMGLIDLDTIKLVVKELKSRKPDVLIYGEPWSGGASPLKNPAGKGTQKNNGFAVFNDNFRDSLRGDTDGTALGWVMGAMHLKQQVLKGMDGSLDDFTASPCETINYLSAHDNYTWYDKLVRSLPDMNPTMIQKVARLGLAVVLTSQGIPFLHAGSEFLRTKRTANAKEEDIRNSYKADDDVNKIDWQRKAEFYDFFDYIKNLIAVRNKYPALRIADPLLIKKRVIPLKTGIPENIITVYIDGLGKDTDLIIIHNPLPEKVTIKLPAGIWKIIFDDNYKKLSSQAVHIDTNHEINPVSTTILELD